MVVMLSALRAGRPLPRSKFLVLSFVRGLVDLWVIVLLEGLDKLKISNELIGKRTRYLPACSIVTQLTALSSVPLNYLG
jgi:hypothetical protein